MSQLSLLSDPEIWNKFYNYKQSLACPKQFATELRSFIDEEGYLPVCERIQTGEPFPLPTKSVLSKMGSDKKRTVYTYPEPENTVLKLLTWLLLRTYDDLFCDGLYSFRPGRTAKDAVRSLLKRKNIWDMYAYKVDIHDYFNSIPVEKLLPMLQQVLSEDKELYSFLARLLSEPCVTDRGNVVEERKGIMAGTPLSSFYANLYLAELDREFAELGVPYARYSDDIIVFGETKELTEQYAGRVQKVLAEFGLTINPKKECYFQPGESIQFLGFSCAKDKVDIAPATVKKLKQKMRRKRDALARWSKRNEVSGEKTAKAFLRVFNRKLLESPQDNELSWSSWFFPVISTTESLHEIDLYAQDCVRYLVSGTHTKARFNVRYEDMKALGYRSLVHEYYAENIENRKR